MNINLLKGWNNYNNTIHVHPYYMSYPRLVLFGYTLLVTILGSDMKLTGILQPNQQQSTVIDKYSSKREDAYAQIISVK